MTKPIISPTHISTLVDKNFTNLRECLDGGLGLENFRGYYLDGTTSTTPDSEMRLNHSMKPQPAGAIPIVGDVYIQAIDEKSIDVRSTKPSVPFRIFLLTSTDAQKTTAPPVSGDYQNTSSFINFLIEGGGGTVTPTQGLTQISVSTAPGVSLASAGSPGNPEYRKILHDSSFSYFITSTSGTLAWNGVFRLNRSTSEVSYLSLGSTARRLGGAFIYNNSLYVSESVPNGTTLSVFVIALSDFTLTTTLSMTSAVSTENYFDMLTDGTNIYWAMTVPATSQPHSRVARASISGGALSKVTVYNPGADSTTAGIIQTIVDQGTYIYVLHTRNLSDATQRICRINKSTFAAIADDTILASVPRFCRTGCAVLNGDYIYFPLSSNAMSDTTAAATTPNDSYYFSLGRWQISTQTFTKTPIGGVSPVSHAALRNNIAFDGQNIFLLGASTDTGMSLVRINVDDAEDSEIRFFAVPTGLGGTAFFGNQGRIYIDGSGNVLLFTAPTASSGLATDICWFTPEL